jgi:hypothetical protein
VGTEARNRNCIIEIREHATGKKTIMFEDGRTA